MGWVRIEDVMTEHPKIAALSDKAFRVHISGLCYSVRHKTDGKVPRSVARQYGWTRKAAELVSAGIWHEIAEGWEINDYLEYNMSRADYEAKRRAGQAGGKQSGETRRSKSEAPASNVVEHNASKHEATAQADPDLRDPIPIPRSDHERDQEDPDPSIPLILPHPDRAEVNRALSNLGVMDPQRYEGIEWADYWLSKLPLRDVINAIDETGNRGIRLGGIVSYATKILEGYVEERSAGREPGYLRRQQKLPQYRPADPTSPYDRVTVSHYEGAS